MHFEKVSKEAWIRQCYRLGIPEQESEPAYANIVIPERATKDSCGYDFACPFDMTITSDRTTMIPTGIRAILDKGTFLMLAPRSSCVKKGYTMSNNIAVIDGDYCEASNEGNIMIAAISTGKVKYAVNFKAGEKIAQGIILPFMTVGDNVETSREGGFGSTDEEPVKEDEPKPIINNPIEDLPEEVDPETPVEENVKEEFKIEEPKEEVVENRTIDNLFEEVSSEPEKVEVDPDLKIIEISSDNPVVEEKKEEVVGAIEEIAKEQEQEEETKEEEPPTPTEPVIMFNNHLSIYSNIVNDTIVNELLSMIEFAKFQDPTMYVKFVGLKNGAKSINDIEYIYKAVNEWYSEIDNPDTLSDIYIRDAYIMFINRVDDFGEEMFSGITNMVKDIRSSKDNGKKLTFGKELYMHITDKEVDKLYEHLRTVYKDLMNS